MSILPGQPGSSNPAQNDWIARRIRELTQEVEQLRGQLSRTMLGGNAATSALASAGVVTHVTVSGSTLTVTYGDGSSHAYTLP